MEKSKAASSSNGREREAIALSRKEGGKNWICSGSRRSAEASFSIVESHPKEK
jgi:hypothetical protein